MPTYEPYSRDKCPHCRTVVRFEEANLAQHKKPAGYIVQRFSAEDGDTMDLRVSACTHCFHLVIGITKHPKSEHVLWPITSARPPAPPEVPENIAQDFNEAALVLQFSPKASAALSRRCLQSVLTDENAGNSQKWRLSDQIDEVLVDLPTHIGENLDYVREIGNFAAHEQKSENSGLILDVSEGEAEWNLRILESLFDFYYVRPEIERQKREEFNKKLEEVGRDPLLQSPGDDDGKKNS